jgi:hypothetical protein
MIDGNLEMLRTVDSNLRGLAAARVAAYKYDRILVYLLHDGCLHVGNGQAGALLGARQQHLVTLLPL